MYADMSTNGRTASISAKLTKAATARASTQKLLDAAVHVIRSKGYSAARVEDICAEAGLTKGAFFHHFASKEACAAAAFVLALMVFAFMSSVAYQPVGFPVKQKTLEDVAFRRNRHREFGAGLRPTSLDEPGARTPAPGSPSGDGRPSGRPHSAVFAAQALIKTRPSNPASCSQR